MVSSRSLVLTTVVILVKLNLVLTQDGGSEIDPIKSLSTSIVRLFSNDTGTKRDGFESFLSTLKVGKQLELVKSACSAGNESCPSFECLDEKAVFDLAVLKSNGNVIDIDGLKAVCPLLLVQSQLSPCGKEETRTTRTGIPTGKAWGFGILFVTMISLCSLIGASVLPLMGKSFYNHLLTVLVGLAVGSLFGSSVFHLIPQAYGIIDPDFDPHHGYLNISLLIFGGFWLFFMIERFLKIIMEMKERTAERKAKEKKKQAGAENHQMQALNPTRTDELCVPIPFDAIYESQEQVIKASFGHMEKPKKHHHGHDHLSRAEGSSVIATVAWMIIFGDGLHNFIDGLSIGAAFSESINTGISISVAVMCEELPHELGDFAVLLASGMSMKQALLYNFLSACTCYLGLAVGIMLGEIEASVYIFALAGGMFLYISLTDMVPELNEVAEASSKESVCAAMKVLTLQNIGIFVGVFALFILAKFQDYIVFNI